MDQAEEEIIVCAFGKLKSQAVGLFRTIKWINNNSCNVDLYGDNNIYSTFNVANLSQYYEDLEAPLDEGDVPPTRGEWHGSVPVIEPGIHWP